MMNFIDSTKNSGTPLLYKMTEVLLYGKSGNCLSLGPGAGNAEIELLENNWNVTAVDKELYSNTVMTQKIKENKKINIKKFEFINTDFKSLELTKNYDYIIAINSVPFMDKKYLDTLMSNIINHSNKDCIITISFFQKKTTNVINKLCFGMTIPSIKKLFKKYDIDIKLIENYITKKDNGYIFDVVGVIGVIKN
jgi:16S rRNA A1518/A1519 N6-dimethyltransferase RsmA/KsgA/DIM1 with predicted DNA glycosylase/AP lyase activity